MRNVMTFLIALLFAAAFAAGCQKTSTGSLAVENADQPNALAALSPSTVKETTQPAAVTPINAVAPVASENTSAPVREIAANAPEAPAPQAAPKAKAGPAPKAKDDPAPRKLVAARTPSPTQAEAQKAIKQIASKSVLVVGDSFAVGVGATMASVLKTNAVALRQKGKISTGLNSPKFYNWESKLREFITEQKPDALIAMVSGNDAHNGANSPTWKQSYAEKTASFLKIPAEKNIPVYLVGLPPMGKPDYSERAKLANEALQNACSNTPDCTYVDSWSLFSDADGNYADKKKLGAKIVSLRAGDGVHFTGSGYQILAQHIIKQLGQQVELNAAQ